MDLSNDKKYRRALLIRQIPEQRKKVQDLEASLGEMQRKLDTRRRTGARERREARKRKRGFFSSLLRLARDPLGFDELGAMASGVVEVGLGVEVEEDLTRERHSLFEMEAELEALSASAQPEGEPPVPSSVVEQQVHRVTEVLGTVVALRAECERMVKENPEDSTWIRREFRKAEDRIKERG